MQEYPRSLYLKGWEDLSATVIVQNAEEEAEARKKGYKKLNESDEAVKEVKPRRRKVQE